MSFPRYPNYKDSGVEWLGEVPAHWTLPKIKSVASFSGGGTPSRENLAYWNGDIPWVSPKDMKVERIVGAEESITEQGLKNSASNLLPPGRVLMVVRSGILKHTIPVAINDTEVTLNQDMKALNLDAGRCVSRFFFRWVQGLNDRLLLAWAKQGATVESIEHTYLAETVIPLPDVAEQTLIVAFLDRETAKIDGLVAEQRRLMELLKEKRQVVISHAVTQGLNPHVPMKTSGIERFGDVPEHWEVLVIKRFSTLHRGYDLTDAERTEGEYPVVTSSGINGTHGSFMVRGPGVVTGRYGSTGRLFYIEDDFWPHNTSLYVSKFHGNYPRFVWYSLQKVDFSAHSAKAAVPGIDRNDIHVLSVAVPPRAEQTAIVTFLDNATAQIDALTTEAQRAIDLLQERRTALISAAVTGKIDVRHLT